MKAWFYTGMLTAAVACLSLGSASLAQAAACSDASLNGKYGQSISGEFLPGPGLVWPQNGVAMTDFDGKGGLTQVDYVVIMEVPQEPDFSLKPVHIRSIPIARGHLPFNTPTGRRSLCSWSW